MKSSIVRKDRDLGQRPQPVEARYIRRPTSADDEADDLEFQMTNDEGHVVAGVSYGPWRYLIAVDARDLKRTGLVLNAANLRST